MTGISRDVGIKGPAADAPTTKNSSVSLSFLLSPIASLELSIQGKWLIRAIVPITMDCNVALMMIFGIHAKHTTT